SLSNCLAGDERAIVTDISGTTRDALRETIEIEGIPLHIIDTAGLRDTTDAVERIGIARTWREIERADVILWMQEAGGSLDAETIASVDAALPPQVERIRVVNKIDLIGAPPERIQNEHGVTLTLSARTGQGVDLLRAELLRVVGWQAQAEDLVLARERHLAALRGALDHLRMAAQQIGALELFAEELRLAQNCVSEITGAFTPDDLLGVIFSRFCIGK
ncbi:MAG TPA: 50S ribosome-binding GTPase, partial [Pseudothauera hydrothermalis]|nr:50S ribosome-binding GTPase [Pseudothauera hydrothermalis]